MCSKDKDNRRYNDNASVSSHATSRAVSSVLSSPRASPAMSATSHSVSSFTTEGGEPDRPSLITCSYPGCTEKTLASQVLCHLHQAGLFAPTSPESSHSSQAPRSSSVNMHAGVEVGRPLLSGIKLNKLLPENDKDRPILRRKTAPGDSLKSRQPPAIQTTVSRSDESTISPTSPQPVLAQPPAYSAHGRPDNFQDPDPMRKRQKLTHPLNAHLEPRQNGAQTSGPTRVGFGGKHKLAKVQTHRTSSYPSTQQRPSRGPEMERNGFKLSSPNRPSPVRKMAPLNPLRSIHDPGSATPSTEMQTLSAESLVDEAALDMLLYRQEGAATPPPEVRIPEPETPAPNPTPPDQPIYADVDPRIHWTLPQSDVWREKKIEEIVARGGRKANFGKAAASLKKQRLEEEESLTFEDALPEKVADNPAWARALKKLESEAKEASVSPAINGITKRKPGPKRQLSNGSVSSSVRGNGADVQAPTRVG
ncbi:hypothetical protein V8F33_010721 [Rhypophila sp. PSN 637]